MNIVLTIVLIISLVLVIAILLQQGKGADGASAFGAGAKNAGTLTSFSAGAKIISALAVLFFMMVFAVHLSSKDKSDAFIEQLEQRANVDTNETDAKENPTEVPQQEQEETLHIPQ